MTGLPRIVNGVLPLLAVTLLVNTQALTQGAIPEDVEIVQEQVEGAYNVVGDIETDSVGDLEARIIFNLQESGDFYSLTIDAARAKFYRRVDGEVEHIGTVGTLTPIPSDATSTPFTLQRRAWRMAFVWGDTVIARAYDDTLDDGGCGTAINSGSFIEPMIQPVGDIFISDDFVREEGAVGVWEPLSGEWQHRTLREDDQADRQETDKSANAFSYLGKGTVDEPGVSVAGYWFWDVYSVKTAIRPMGNDPVGLIIHAQDADSYIAVRWFGRGHPDGGKLQIVAVDDGEETVIAGATGGYLSGQWYALRAAVSEGRIHVWIDDELRLSGQTDMFGQGQIGLYAGGEDGCFFDDVVCGPWELFVEDFDAEVPGKWTSLAGTFHWQESSLQATDGVCAAVTGRSDWSEYAYSANVHSANSGVVGLIVAASSPEEYCRMEWTETRAKATGRARIVKVTPEGDTVLAEAPLTVPPKSWHRARASVQEGLLRLVVDGRVQVEALDLNVTGGAIGVYAADAAGARFDNAMVEMIPPQQTSRILEEFTDTSQHFEMVEWASTRAPWVKPDDDDEIWWTKGEYFGDHALVFPVSQIGSKAGEITLILGSPTPDADAEGYRVRAAVEKGSKEIQFTVLRGDQELATGSATAGDEKATITLQRRSHWLILRLDETPVLHVDMTGPVPPTEEPGDEAETTQDPDRTEDSVTVQ